MTCCHLSNPLECVLLPERLWLLERQEEEEGPAGWLEGASPLPAQPSPEQQQSFPWGGPPSPVASRLRLHKENITAARVGMEGGGWGVWLTTGPLRDYKAVMAPVAPENGMHMEVPTTCPYFLPEEQNSQLCPTPEREAGGASYSCVKGHGRNEDKNLQRKI